MKTNQELQTDVQNAVKWESLLNAAEISRSYCLEHFEYTAFEQ
jgi:hypothetical protein